MQILTIHLKFEPKINGNSTLNKKVIYHNFVDHRKQIQISHQAHSKDLSYGTFGNHVL